MASQSDKADADFVWQPQPKAAALVDELVEKAVAESEILQRVGQRMRDETGTRLIDWIDTIVVEDSANVRDRLANAGFSKRNEVGTRWTHAAGLFPVVWVQDADRWSLTVKVESAEHFAEAWSREFQTTVSGPTGGQYRLGTCAVRNEGDSWPRLGIIERHGAPGWEPPKNSAQQIAMAAKHLAAMHRRRRAADDPAEGFSHAAALHQAAAADLNPAWATDLFFAAERSYWMSRNAAARVQYERQQELGLGWANHDHHTYRSSRACFHLLVATLEQMGFTCRERFYAGEEAGWGAQVLEHADTGVVIFADVDLSPEEVADDFAHEPLAPRDELGTVGLWCKLHGESFLEAGMHHLECQFDFDAAREQLAAAGIETMAPFTDFPYLKQAFTQGEMWTVDEARLQAALDGGYITAEQADGFRRDGALGSHLEILERNDGYKGFNQTGISEIITRTDPRKWS